MEQIQLQTPTGQTLLENPDKDLKIEQFKLVKQISIFVACQACKRKIHYISQKSMKCKYCRYAKEKKLAQKIKLFNSQLMILKLDGIHRNDPGSA